MAHIRLIKPISERYGSYNKSKYKVLSVLNGIGGYIPIVRLAIFTGIPYRSLAILLKRYANWNYITVQDRPEYLKLGRTEYRIAPKGVRWLTKADDFLLEAPKFRQELNIHLARVLEIMPELDKLTFSKAIKRVGEIAHDERIRENQSSK